MLQPHVVDQGRRSGLLVDLWAQWSNPVQGRNHPDHPDAVHSVQACVAVALPVMQPTSVPPGPKHELIDSIGLQVAGAGQWLEAKHGAKLRRTRRKLHLTVATARNMIVA